MDVVGEMKKIYTEMMSQEEMILKSMIVGLGIYDTDLEVIQRKLKEKNAAITVMTSNKNTYERVIGLDVDYQAREVWKIETVFEYGDFGSVTAIAKSRRIR